jgi:hypothetical protein
MLKCNAEKRLKILHQWERCNQAILANEHAFFSTTTLGVKWHHFLLRRVLVLLASQWQGRVEKE